VTAKFTDKTLSRLTEYMRDLLKVWFLGQLIKLVYL